MARARGSSNLERLRRTIRTDAQTSARLSAIRTHGTAAELTVRRALAQLGHSFRVANPDLPGKPDIANRRRRWAVFVHGCFWHSHAGCRRAALPRSNPEFWRVKLDTNVARDARVQRELRRLGFRVVVVWQCELRDVDRLARVLARRLPSP